MISDYENIDIAIIGGGCAGLSAAIAASKAGARDIVIFEREPYLGGILTQCIHNGFGLELYNCDLTGTQYAGRLISEAEARGITFLTATTVLSVSLNKVLTVVSKESGITSYHAGAIIFATGCRERTRETLLIPGSRPAGVITAGAAQKLLNIDGYLVGKKIIILGSGDIGLIMARQFVLEGAEVTAVAEIMPYSSGLTRNLVQCLDDFSIPIYYNTTVARISGNKRVEGVTLAQVDKDNTIIPETAEYYPCDALVLSVGLIPENELITEMGLEISSRTGSPLVDETLQSEAAGIFICGNSLHVHDLADYVSLEGEEAGRNAARYIATGIHTDNSDTTRVICGNGVASVTPQRISKNGSSTNILFNFRSSNRFLDRELLIYSGLKLIKKQKYRVITPGEMCRVQVPKEPIHDEVILSIRE